MRHTTIFALVCMWLACGGRSGDVELGGETNWFGWCQADTDCIVGDCVCGICTRECSAEAPSCADGPAESVCVLPNNGGFPGLCESETPSGVCLTPCSDQDPCGDGLECTAGWCMASTSLGPTGAVTDPTGPLCTESSVLRGSWAARSPEELERFRGCTEIGTLIIEAGLIESLEPLSELRAVTGSLTIAPQPLTSVPRPLANVSLRLPSLAGLSSLERVGILSLEGLAPTYDEEGNLAWARFADADIEGPAQPVQVNSLGLADFPELTNLSGLANISVSRGIGLDRLPALRDASGPSLASALESLTLSGVPQLEDLAPFSGLTSVEFLTLIDVGAVNVDALAGLRQTGTLTILSNARLDNVDALGNIEGLSSLSVQNNEALTRLPEFARVIEIQTIEVLRNPQLALLGFSSLELSEGWIYVYGNESLREVDFGQLARAARFQVESNPSLVRLDLGALSSVDDFSVSGNASLLPEGVSVHPDMAPRFELSDETP